jgi:hypothetical protein
MNARARSIFITVSFVWEVSVLHTRRVQASRARTEQQVAVVVNGLSDAQLRAQGMCPPGIPTAEAGNFIKKFMVDEFLGDHGMGESRGTDVLEKEKDWYKEMDCFYPPGELEVRHPGLVALKARVMELGAKGEHPNPDERVVFVVRILRPELHATCLRMFLEYIGQTRNILRLGSLTSCSL